MSKPLSLPEARLPRQSLIQLLASLPGPADSTDAAGPAHSTAAGRGITRIGRLQSADTGNLCWVIPAAVGSTADAGEPRIGAVVDNPTHPIAGVAVLDGGRFVRVNRQFEKLTGWTALELDGASPAGLFGGLEAWQALLCRMDQAVTVGGSFVEELTLARRDGATRHCEIHVSWIAHEGASETNLTLHDITRLKQVENQRLEEVRAQRDLVIREVHHRIKNNLQGVAGLMQQLAVRKPEAAGALSEVASQITSIAQVYALKVREQERLAFADLLAAVLGSLARTTGVKIALTVSDPVLARRGWLSETDAVPIALVINEIATNAIKHRQTGGELHASLDLEGESFCVRISNPGRLAWRQAGAPKFESSVFGLGLIKAMLPRRGANFELSEQAGQVIARVLLSAPALDLSPI